VAAGAGEGQPGADGVAAEWGWGAMSRGDQEG